MGEDTCFYILYLFDIRNTENVFNFIFIYRLRIAPESNVSFLFFPVVSPLDVYRRLKLSCSLTSYDESCQQHKIIWLDETGTELLSDHFLVKEPVIFVIRWKCVSVLTVKHSESNKRFTCQIVQNNKVKIDAVYFLTSKRTFG